MGSALMFGLVHQLNVAQGADLLVTLLQVVYAFTLACAFAAGLEVGGCLAPLVAAHPSTDLFPFIAGGGVVNGSDHANLVAVVTLVYIVVFGAYTIATLRSSAGAAVAS